MVVKEEQAEGLVEGEVEVAGVEETTRPPRT